jgi:hypothetical protein
MNSIRLDMVDAEREPLLARELSLMQDALERIYTVPLEPFCGPLPVFRLDPAEPRV